MTRPANQTRSARIAAAALTAVALSVLAVPGSAGAYPPEPSDRSIILEAAGVVCEGDTPYIRYEASTQGYDADVLADLTATVTVMDSSGDVVAGPLSGQPLVGQLLYPGAAVDASGRATDWPGWVRSGGGWVPDPSDAHLQSGLRLTVLVESEISAALQYPPDSEACMSPDGQSSPAGVSPGSQDVASGAGSLPSTGSGPSPILWIAAAALLAGVVISAATFRRRGADSTSN